MAKRNKLTTRQKRRVSSNLQKRLDNKDAAFSDEHLGEQQPGVVTGRFGQHADVEVDGEIFRCHIRRNIQDVVCGDKVLFRQGKDAGSNVSGVIEAVEPRSSVLTRPDYYDGVKPNCEVPPLQSHH